MTLARRILVANPTMQVSDALSGSISLPSAKLSVTNDLGSYNSIATFIADGTSTALTISNIPSTYRHLVIRIHCQTQGTGADGAVLVGFNGASNYAPYNHYYYTAVSGSGSNSGSGTSGYIMNASGVNNYWTSAIFEIDEYTNANKLKIVKNWVGYPNPSGYMFLYSGYWNSYSAITSLTFTSTNGNWTAGSKFSVYGLEG